MGFIIVCLKDEEEKGVMEGKICSVDRKTPTLSLHKNKWFKVNNRMYRILDTIKNDDIYRTYFAFMGMYGNDVERCDR